MNRTISLLTSAGSGTGLTYFLDPKRGRQRRAHIREKMIHASHKIQDARDTVIRDARNRLPGLAAGDLSILVGAKNALRDNPLCGGWSPTGRVLLGMIGGGLFLSGLRLTAATTCTMGKAGLALMIEGATNAGIEDVTHMPSKLANIARKSFGHDGRSTGRREHASA